MGSRGSRQSCPVQRKGCSTDPAPNAPESGAYIRFTHRGLYRAAGMTHDYIVLGGGAAGLTASGIGASLGAKTLLVEAHRLGGDCTWTGCIPSKTLLSVARKISQARYLERANLVSGSIAPNLEALQRHIHAVRAHVYDEADAPPRLEAFGVEVREARARFLDRYHVQVEDASGGMETVSARKILIATGAAPAVPNIPGLEGTPYLTSDSLFDLERWPSSLLILGGGPIGCEMAFAFTQLGTRVTVLEAAPTFLPREDAFLAPLLRKALEAEGIHIQTGAEVTHVAHGTQGFALTTRTGNMYNAEALLVATGRIPRTANLGLEAAGIPFTARGIEVDARCRTGVKGIFAAGDVTGQFAHTHMSEHMAKIATTNALMRLPMRVQARAVPRVIYTHPELAAVGASETDLTAQGIRFETYAFPFHRSDRAITEDETAGWVRIFATPSTGKILGAAVLGAHAGELIGTLGLALSRKMTLRHLSDTIFAYPTWTLTVRRAADQWYARQQSTARVRWIQRIFGFRGPLPTRDPNAIV